MPPEPPATSPPERRADTENNAILGAAFNPVSLNELEFRLVSIALAENFAGPLPHPQHFSDYEAVSPGAGDRLIAMAEKEQLHRHQREDRTLTLEFRAGILGSILGFLVAAGLLALAYLCTQTGHDAVALGFLAASTVGMVTPFIRGRAGVKRSD